MTFHRKIVLAILLLIGLFDLYCGLHTLFAAEPWLDNGMNDAWLRLPVALRNDVQLQAYALGPSRFLGAFRLYAGMVTCAWAWGARRDTRALTLLLATYTLAGLGLAWCDRTFATDINWQQLKQIFGFLWVVALLVHGRGWWLQRRQGAAARARTF